MDKEREERDKRWVLAKQQEEDDEEDHIRKLAKVSGIRQQLRIWTTSRCMSRNEDCSFDTAYTFALPDGRTETEYSCCY